MRTLIVFILVSFLLNVQAARAVERGGLLTYDLGVSAGKYSDTSYTEANFGLNWYAQNWLAWRNAIFGRFQSDSQTAYGLDSSLRLIADVGAERAGFTAFIAPGYRFASGTSSAPFAEEGLMLHLGGLTIGAGAKQILDSWVHTGAANDNQYFFILGGGGVL